MYTTSPTNEATDVVTAMEQDFISTTDATNPMKGSGWNGFINHHSQNYSNNTSSSPEAIGFEITWDDATWILTSSFIIFTMQSGFGLLEAGNVSMKNEVNIMVKNAVDVVFGGLTYWIFGYGLSFGMDKGTNWFCGVGYWFVHTDDVREMGPLYSTFFFQLSFATTATTIVSGAMAERTKLTAYIIFSLCNTIMYCVPAHWIWAGNGFLYEMGVVDIAGSGGVHLLGASSALVAALMLGPRRGRYDNGTAPLPAGNSTNCLLGMFMLWWGWLGFNCGSTFGISGGKWILAAKTSVTTINGSMGGGAVAILFTFIVDKGKYDISKIVNGILGALVSVTAPCALIEPWEAVVIGAIGAFIVLLVCPLMDKLHIDDPVAAVPVHGCGGIWGMLAVGLFVKPDGIIHLSQGRAGLFHGGGFYMLGIQSLTCVCVMAWSGIVTFTLLGILKLTMGIRLSEEHEMLGSDLVEHAIDHGSRFGSIMSLDKLSFTKEDNNKVRDMEMDENPQKIYIEPRPPKRSAFGFARSLVSRKSRRHKKSTSECSEDKTGESNYAYDVEDPKQGEYDKY